DAEELRQRRPQLGDLIVRVAARQLGRLGDGLEGGGQRTEGGLVAGELDRTGMVAAGDVRRNGIEVRPNLRGHPPTICPPPEFPCGRASHVQFLPKIRNRPYAGFMSGTYDDLAPLRVGDDMATEGESEPDRRPAAHQQVPITVVEPE